MKKLIVSTVSLVVLSTTVHAGFSSSSRGSSFSSRSSYSSSSYSSRSYSRPSTSSSYKPSSTPPKPVIKAITKITPVTKSKPAPMNPVTSLSKKQTPIKTASVAGVATGIATTSVATHAQAVQTHPAIHHHTEDYHPQPIIYSIPHPVYIPSNNPQSASEPQTTQKPTVVAPKPKTAKELQLERYKGAIKKMWVSECKSWDCMN